MFIWMRLGEGWDHNCSSRHPGVILILGIDSWLDQGKYLRFKAAPLFPAAPLLPNYLLADINNISITL